MTEPTGTGHLHAEAPPSPRPPLRRDTDAGLVGGVAAGLARHLDIDVVLVRIGFVVGTILTQGLGLVAYVLCWIFISKAEEGTTPRPPAATSVDGRGAPFWVGVGLLTLGALWFLGAMPWPVLFGFGWLDGGVLVPLLLIGLGVALWRSSGRTPTSTADAPGAGPPASWDAPPPPANPAPSAGPSPSGSPASGSPASESPTAGPSGSEPLAASSPPSAIPAPASSNASTEQTMPSTTMTPPGAGRPPADPPPTFDAEVADDQHTMRLDRPVGDQAATPPPPQPPAAPAEGDGFVPPPVPPKSRSMLTRATLGLALLAVGALWVLEVTTTLALGPVRILAIALAIVGAGLLLGSWVGRGRLLIIPGMLLLPLVVAGLVLRGLPAGEFVDRGFIGNAQIGDVAHQVIDIEDLESSYSLGAGSFRLDLTALELDDDVSTLVEFGAGEVVIIVPEDINVEVYGSLFAGELNLFDERAAGMAFERRTAVGADVVGLDDVPSLDLRVNGGFGVVTVRR